MTNKSYSREGSDMKAIYRILSELQHNDEVRKEFVLENYTTRPEDFTMPWEKYLAKGRNDRTNQGRA